MSARCVTAIVPDLFFATRIATTGVATGVDVRQPTAAAALDDIRSTPPELVIVDLTAGPAIMDLVRALKADSGIRTIPIVGFYPHVDRGLRESALAAGVDLVLPRSAFTTRLAALLAGEGLSPRRPDC